MDPDTNLREQLALAREIIELVDGNAREDGSMPDDVAQEVASKADELANLVDAMGEWLNKGGFPPTARGTVPA